MADLTRQLLDYKCAIGKVWNGTTCVDATKPRDGIGTSGGDFPNIRPPPIERVLERLETALEHHQAVSPHGLVQATEHFQTLAEKVALAQKALGRTDVYDPRGVKVTGFFLVKYDQDGTAGHVTVNLGGDEEAKPRVPTTALERAAVAAALDEAEAEFRSTSRRVETMAQRAGLKHRH